MRRLTLALGQIFAGISWPGRSLSQKIVTVHALRGKEELDLDKACSPWSDEHGLAVPFSSSFSRLHPTSRGFGFAAPP